MVEPLLWPSRGRAKVASKGMPTRECGGQSPGVAEATTRKVERSRNTTLDLPVSVLSSMPKEGGLPYRI